MTRRRGGKQVGLLAAALVLIAMQGGARADFSGPYYLPTQPYFISGSPPQVIPAGTWVLTTSGATTESYAGVFAYTNSTEVGFMTGITALHSLQPSLLIALTNTIAADGMLSFDFSLSLNATGQFQGYNYGAYTLDGNVIQLQPGVGSVSIPVTAGDAFGFLAYAAGNCIGCNPSFAGGTTITIDNFSAPVPEPTAPCLLVFGFLAFALLKRFRASSSIFRSP